ncbi:MAG: carboxypeptidase M32 [Cucumibacter sp.]
MSFAKLDALGHRIEALDHALSILRADEATHMPAGGGEKRAGAVAALAAIRHAEASAAPIADWIEAAATEALNDDQQAALREFRRAYLNLTCLPSEFVERQTIAAMRCEQLWRELRPQGDWPGLLPALSTVIGLVREEAQRRADRLGLAPYDALIEQYDPGSRAAAIAPVFDKLKSFLKDFVPEAMARQQERLAAHSLREIHGPFPIDKQRALGLEMMAALGFDFTHGRLDVSHHPFCGGVPTDVRMTTRYRTDDFLTALMGILHETGHALYEQNLPKQWSHWPLGQARGMALHESQSLFVEQQIARHPAFWQWALPRLRHHLGAGLDGWTVEDVLAHVLYVERGLIRVDADETTYPLHVILRFELEQELVTGQLDVADLPEAWDARMTDYLGLRTVDDPANGPMQDVHWPGGTFGYFPSYTLGALIAAQQWRAITEAMPRIESDLARGDFRAVNDWRRKNIWEQASRYSTPELIKKATGHPLDATIFITHLKARYAA